MKTNIRYNINNHVVQNTGSGNVGVFVRLFSLVDFGKRGCTVPVCPTLPINYKNYSNNKKRGVTFVANQLANIWYLGLDKDRPKKINHVNRFSPGRF